MYTVTAVRGRPVVVRVFGLGIFPAGGDPGVWIGDFPGRRRSGDLDWGFSRPAAVRGRRLGCYYSLVRSNGRPGLADGGPGIWIGDFPGRRRSGIGDRPGYAANFMTISVVPYIFH